MGINRDDADLQLDGGERLMSGIVTTDVASTATAKATGGSIYGVIIYSTGSAGSVIIRDNGATGTIRFKYVTAVDEATRSIVLPMGVRFDTDIHVTLSNATCALIHD